MTGDARAGFLVLSLSTRFVGCVRAMRARRVDVVGVGDVWEKGKGCSTSESESIRQMHGQSFGLRRRLVDVETSQNAYMER